MDHPGARPDPVPQVVDEAVVCAGGRRWRRILVRTPWLSADDDLVAALREALEGVAGAEPEHGATVAVAEKVAVLTGGLAVPGSRVRAGRLARALAASVRPVGDSRGLSVPEKMQYVIDDVGRLRVLAASVATVLTRPFGYRGAFYRLAGPVARDVDGMRGAYPDTLLPPLQPATAAALVDRLAASLGRPVAVVDINDRGGSIRAVSAGGPPPAVLFAALADNPMGHLAQSTPVVVLQPLP